MKDHHSNRTSRRSDQSRNVTRRLRQRKRVPDFRYFLCNPLILILPGINKALHRPFRSDVWILSQTVVCFCLWSGRFCASVPAVSGREPVFRSGQRILTGVLRRWSRRLTGNNVCVCCCGEGSRPAQRSVPFGCGPDSSGGRACSNACAGAAGSRRPYNRSRYEPGPPGPFVGSSDKWAGS